MTGVEKNCLFYKIFCVLDLLNIDLDMEEVLKSWDLEKLVNLCKGLKKIESGLIGQDTKFDRILSGQIQISNRTNSSDKCMLEHVDEVGKEVCTDVHPRPADQIHEKVYKKTMRHEDGRDTVRLPFENAAETPRTSELRVSAVRK
ncbi:hypothetical protein JTB14_036932 [Gonioctena quinquepunctata]|nr:hypothetical protein JTB14_036932 [Gonioctena quinquepunctata]